jgi:putative type IC restriction-modification system specificity subunit, partial
MEKKNQVPKYPLLRFPEFTDEWKEVKLGEVAEISKGSGISKDQLSPHGLPCILYGELYTKYSSELISEIISHTELDPLTLIFSKAEDVIIPSSGETAIDIAVARCVPIAGVAIGGDLNIIRSEDTDGVFLAYQLNGIRKKGIAKMAQGSSIVHLYGHSLSKLAIAYPSLPEQRKIAALLGLIDERIEVQNAIIKEQEVAKTLLSKELLTPENDWTEYAVQDCLTYEQPAKYIVKHTDYSSDSTLTPVLTANKGFILGYTSEQGIYQKGACIIFDDFTLDCKYVPFAFKVKSSAIKILQARKGFDIRFMFEVIKSLSLSPFAHKRHYISEVEPIKILVPSFAKQEKIARLFAALDECLDVERAYAEQLKQQKAYLLRQMFI